VLLANKHSIVSVRVFGGGVDDTVSVLIAAPGMFNFELGWRMDSVPRPRLEAAAIRSITILRRFDTLYRVYASLLVC